MISAKKERMTTMVTVTSAEPDLKCDNGGKVQLLKHCLNQKHKEAMQHRKDGKQTKLTFTVRLKQLLAHLVKQP